MKKLMFALIQVAGAMVATQSALAADSFRCEDMPYLPSELAPANNSWGTYNHVFDYLGGAKEVFVQGLNSAQQFAVYAVGPTIIKSPWPLYPGISVPGTARFLSVCPAGCYAPTEKVMFDGSYVSMEDAYKRNLPTITSLTAETTAGAMSFAEQPIQSYVVGESKEDMLIVEADNGKKVQVTANHPLVNGEGEVVPASSLRVGDEILNADRSIASVTRVQKQSYDGWVMSVMPVSSNKRENVHVANGFLGGSVRFQAQWASDVTRLLHRDLFDLTTP